MKNHRKKIKQYRGRIITLQTNQTNVLNKIKNLESTLNDLKQQISKEKHFQEESQKRIDDLTGNIENKEKLSKERTLQEESQKRKDDCSQDCGECEKKINKKQLQHTQLNDELLLLQQLTQEIVNRQDRDTKRYLSVVSIVAVFAIVAISFSFFQTVVIGTEYTREFNSNLKTGYVIQNLRGDTIDTWIAWKIVEGDTFHVHVVDSIYANKERLDVIFDVIMSTEELEIDDSLLHKGPKGSASTYYVGWGGALNSINDNTEFPIPKNLHFDVSNRGEGDIIIELTNLSSADGYSGFTKAIVDETENQILKSSITIYNIENIDNEQLKTILRHELGHGFGLAHSSAPEDLMAPTITTAYPYISGCDLDAIELLYDGGKTSQVICEK